MQETRAVRPSEALDWVRLAAYLREHLPAADIAAFDPAQVLEVEQFPGGRSNLTYLLRLGDVEMVLRRPPFGPVAPTAHDMSREYRWLSALHAVFPLAPRPYLLCRDPRVIGSFFYVMERRRGVVVRDEEAATLAEQPAARRRAGEALVDALVDLHRIDVTAHGLGSLGKPVGFIERQVRGWTERWHASKTSAIPDMEAVAEWLRAHLPPDPASPSIVHGDFKLDNVMLDAGDPGRIVAVLDWEMSALGDPLVDVGILLTYWAPTSPPRTSGAADLVTARPGWPTRDEIVARYAARSGRDLSAIGFYEIFGRFKVAVVVQQLFRRYATGGTDDPRFAAFDARVQYLAREAAARAIDR
ncbi:MAG: phosphotransferase family protein [Vicinamibacterales bacterium]